MKLKTLLKGLAELEVKGSKEVEITGLSADSRTTAPGNLFFARKGTTHQGADFIPQARRAGAAAIVTDLYDPFAGVAQILHSSPLELEGVLASRFYGEPSEELFVAAVTGSKGKTTTTYMIWHLLGGLEANVGLLGTVETIVGGERRPSAFTSHMAIQTQKFLRDMVTHGGKGAVLEASSHGLHQGRLSPIDFDVGVFTNLYPDHLDYHVTVEEYAAAKKILFERVDQSKKKKKRVLLNGDSPWIPFMCQGISTPVWTFGLNPTADLWAHSIEQVPRGTSCTIEFQGKKCPFLLPLIGEFNIYNALAAIGVGLHLGMPLSHIAERLASFESAPGRLERVPNDKGLLVFVDYAHTGESLRNVLGTLRKTSPKRILCLFGCGGARDPARRPQMGAAAEALADLIMVTSDNPRNEDPQAIVDQILSGFSSPEKALVELDRKRAIHQLLALAEPGDLVLIAGKGHEKVQIFSHQTVPFDDVAIAQDWLKR